MEENKPLPPLTKEGSIIYHQEDEAFLKLMSGIDYVEHTIVDVHRCANLHQIAKSTQNIRGAAAEIGVFRGGTMKLICRTLPEKVVYGFDTFTGQPDTCDVTKDYHRPGDIGNTDYNRVVEYLKDCGNAVVRQGFFPDTAKDIDTLKFAFVHVDVDIYRSVKDCCEFFYPRLSAGGAMVFDDYGYHTCPGAKLAVDEFIQGKPETIVYLLGGQAFFYKQV